MNRNLPCYWSKSRSCNKSIFEDTENIFIIGSCDTSREKYRERIENLIIKLKMNPIFAENLEENNNMDAFCDSICGHIRGSRLIINDIFAPLRQVCKSVRKMIMFQV